MSISFSTCQKEEKESIWVKIIIYAVLLQFQTCRNLRVFSIPLNWSSSILPSHSIPLKPILILYHPLVYTPIWDLISPFRDDRPNWRYSLLVVYQYLTYWQVIWLCGIFCRNFTMNGKKVKLSQGIYVEYDQVRLIDLFLFLLI